MNILTNEQWAEWRLSPVTQEFLEYLRLKKQEITRQKMDIISGPVEQINGYDLSKLNGLEAACTGILNLTLETMTSEMHGLKEIAKGYKTMMKESMGVDL